MTAFSHTTPMNVRSRDLDANGHVNNTVYADYLEQARTEYVRGILEPSFNEYGIVLVQLEIEYLDPIHIDDDVSVETRVSSIGDTSFTFAYRVETDDGVAATAESVQVVLNAQMGEGTRVPDDWRRQAASSNVGS